MKDSPTPPPAPDPTATANAQSGANIQTAIANARLNRVNQATPWGSITYTQGPTDANGVPTWSSNIQLSPAQQALLEQQQGQQLGRGQLANQFLSQVSTQPLNFSGLEGVQLRDHTWNGNPQQPPQQQQGGMPQSQSNGIDMNQIMAMLHQAQTQQGQPQQGQTQPQVPPPSAPPPTTQPHPGMANVPTTTAPFQPNYQDYLQNALGLNSSENPTQPMSEAQWNALPPEQQWGLLGYGSQGFNVRPGDSRYDPLKSVVGGENGRAVNVMPGEFTSNVNNHGIPRFNDPSHVYQGNGYYASSDDNSTAASQRQGGMTDLQWALAVASMFAGGALAGSGAGAAGDVMAAAPGEGFGTAGLGAGTAGAAPAGAASSGLYPNESAGLNMGNQFPSQVATQAGAPVTDLSTQAQTPSLWRQALTNVQQGRGLLGLNSTGARAGSGLASLLLSGRSRRSSGGSQ